MAYVVLLLRTRDRVSVPDAGTLAGSRASLNVTLNVSVPGFTAPFLFVTARFEPLVVGPLVSYVNVRELFSDRLPGVSTVHATTWYDTPFASWLVDSGVFQDVVPVATTEVFVVTQLLPLQ